MKTYAILLARPKGCTLSSVCAVYIMKKSICKVYMENVYMSCLYVKFFVQRLYIKYIL